MHGADEIGIAPDRLGAKMTATLIFADFKSKFLAKTIAGDGCRIWTAGKFKSGYGKLRVGARTCYAHRVAYEMFCGPIPDGMVVCHSCDNPACVSHEHLFLGTHADNVRDKIAKGRGARGTMQGSAKLTDKDVLAIRASKGVTQQLLGEQFGVHQVTISKIRLGERWSWLT